MQPQESPPTSVDVYFRLNRLPHGEVPAWEKVSAGLAVIFWGMLVPPIVGFLLGLLLVALLDFRHPDIAFKVGCFGLVVAYTIWVLWVSVGLFLCCRLPVGFKGKSFAQAAFVLTLTSGSLLPASYTVQLLLPSWFNQIFRAFSSLATLLHLITWFGAGLAIISGLLFLRRLAQHFGKDDLASQTCHDIVWFCSWVAGMLVLPTVADRLVDEAPWPRFVVVAWLFVISGMLLVEVTRVAATLRFTIRRALGHRS